MFDTQLPARRPARLRARPRRVIAGWEQGADRHAGRVAWSSSTCRADLAYGNSPPSDAHPARRRADVHGRGAGRGATGHRGRCAARSRWSTPSDGRQGARRRRRHGRRRRHRRAPATRRCCTCCSCAATTSTVLLDTWQRYDPLQVIIAEGQEPARPDRGLRGRTRRRARACSRSRPTWPSARTASPGSGSRRTPT